MFQYIYISKNSLITKFLSAVLCLSLIVAPSASYAQVAFPLPAVGTLVRPSSVYTPVHMLGMTLHPDNPLKIDFIMDRGDDHLEGDAFEAESQKLLSYFYAAMTVPEDEMWVNLSPYEEHRIMADGLKNTVLGRDMLAQDYLLKQLSASMAYPEDALGQKFWQRVRQKVKTHYGNAEVPLNTFNKIWIVPDQAKVFVHEQSVFVVENYLKVMIEEDYLALEQHGGIKGYRDSGTKKGENLYPSVPGSLSPFNHNQITREILIPEIEYEVNHGKHFAPLRQMFHAMVLATWYKQNLKSSILTQSIADQNKTTARLAQDSAQVQKIYDQYIQAFEVGVYDYIKEEHDEFSQEMIPRKYFSGGVQGDLSIAATAKTFASIFTTRRTSGLCHDRNSG